MRLKKFILPITIAAIALIVLLFSLKNFFLRNYTSYLLNQKQIPAALQILDSLQASNPLNRRTVFLKTKALVLKSDYQEAIKISTDQDLRSEYPEILYWRALAQNQVASNDSAIKSAQEFLKSGITLSGGRNKLARAIAGEQVLLDNIDGDALPLRTYFPIEQATYNDIAARYQAGIGRPDIAAKLFKESFYSGNRAPEFLFEAARVSALVGDIYGATMFYDYSEYGSIAPLFKKLESQLESDTNVSLTLNGEDLALGMRRIDIARAFAWSAVAYLTEDIVKNATVARQAVKNVLKQYPYDPVLQMRKAAMLERFNQYQEAYAIYENLQETFPTFVTLLRMAGIEKMPESTLFKNASEFIIKLRPVASLNPQNVKVSGGDRKADSITFISAGTVSGTVDVNQRGNYILNLLAKGDRAAGKWPLLAIRVDDKFIGNLYVCREHWDCFPLTVSLATGTHKVEFEYINNSISNSKADRNFYFRAAYIIGAGSTDVR